MVKDNVSLIQYDERKYDKLFQLEIVHTIPIDNLPTSDYY